MKKTGNNLTALTLIVFTAFYGLTLIINAFQAISGRAELAAHQYPLFAGTVIFTLGNLTKAQRIAIVSISARLRQACVLVVRRVSRCLRCSFKSLGRMPAAFRAAYRDIMSEEAC